MITKVPAKIAKKLLAFRLAEMDEARNLLQIRLLGWTQELCDEGQRLNRITMQAYNDYMAVDPMIRYKEFDRTPNRDYVEDTAEPNENGFIPTPDVW